MSRWHSLRLAAPIIAIAFSCLAHRAGAVLYTNFNEWGSTVNGYQDDFDGTTLDPRWQARGESGVYSLSGDGRLIMATAGGSLANHLVFNDTYSNTSQEVLALVRTDVAPSGGDYRFGVSALLSGSQALGINSVLLPPTAPNLPTRVGLLNDAVDWGNTASVNWSVGQWYWLRLQATQSGAINSRIWAAGSSPEPTTWDITWSGQNRTGLAGLVNTISNQGGPFQIDYVLIKAAGLPAIEVGTVPEPTSAAVAFGLAALVGARRRRRSR